MKKFTQILFFLCLFASVAQAQIPNIIASYADTFNTFTFNEIANSNSRVQAPRDLDFHPLTGELWVINTGTENSGGSTVTFTNPGEPNQTSLWRQDGNAWHFMSLPSGIAFSDSGNFATSTSVYDSNHNGGQPFTGPALWSSDPAIYARPSGGNGSHLDMLHQSPYCMGIAHEVDNVFWVTDANSNDIVRYDFADDHGPGNDYHADAIVRRYHPGAPFQWVSQDVSSHLVLDKSTDWLYVVNGGSDEVIRLDITSGTPWTTPSFGPFEPLAEYKSVIQAKWEKVVTTGLNQPSGIDVIGDYMVVSEYSSGDIITYDISSMPATELSRIKTNEPGAQGLVIGPDGKIWFVNSIRNKVVRIEPGVISYTEKELPKESQFSLYPNPSSGLVTIVNNKREKPLTISVQNFLGQKVYEQTLLPGKTTINISSLIDGWYYVNDGETTQKLLIQH